MDADDLFETQKQWAEEGLTAVRQALPLMAPVGQFADWSAIERQTVRFLLTSTARASESALLLCAYGQLWDAEVLARAVLEGTLKFAYLVQNRESFEARHAEYAQDLFAIAQMKDHLKCVELLAAVRDPDEPRWQPIKDRLIDDEELAELRTMYDRAHRRELENRWGFTGLVGELSGSGDKLFRDLGGLAHTYSMASHVAHMDMIGASMPLDRDLRSDDRRESIHFAHEGRLIGDIFIFLYFRLVVGYRYVGADPAPLRLVADLVAQLSAKFGTAHAAWMSVEYPDDAT